MSDALDLFIYSGSLFSPVLLASSDSFFLSKEESSLSLHVARLDKHTPEIHTTRTVTVL